MMRRNLKVVNSKTDNLLKGRQRRAAQPFPVQSPRLYRRSNGILVDSVTELNEMVEQMGNLKLDKATETVPEPQPSVSNERPKSTSDASSSTMDISEDPPAKVETTLSWTMELVHHNGNTATSIRAALESESKYHLITEKCRRKLKLPLFKLTSPLSTLVPTSRKVFGKTVITFSSHFNKKRVFTLEAIVIDKICRRSPSMIIHPSIKQQLDFFKLADPKFDTPASVDLVVGSALYPPLIKGRPCFVIGKSCSVLQSLLGWVIGGKVPVDDSQTNKTKDDGYQKLKKTIKEVEMLLRSPATPRE